MSADVLGLFGVHKLRLARGAHKARDSGVCLMEAVAWFADEPHSDSPKCVDVVLASFGRRLNDLLLDNERQALVDLIPRLAGTDGSADLSNRRRWKLIDGVIRTVLPVVFAPEWPAHAEAMRNLPEVTHSTAKQAQQTCNAASSAAAAAKASAASYAASYASYAPYASYASYASSAAIAATAASYAASYASSAASAAAETRAVVVGLTIAVFSSAIDLR